MYRTGERDDLNATVDILPTVHIVKHYADRIREIGSLIFSLTGTIMNNSPKKARERILQDVTIKCRMCASDMFEVIDLYDNTVCGFSCPNCPNYILYESVTTDLI